MKARIIFAGVLGGIAMFIWTSIAHTRLPLGEAGLREIPNEQAVLTVMQQNIGDTEGLYIFPGFGLGPEATRQQKNEAMKQWIEKYSSTPVGLLMYRPVGRRFAIGRWLGIEFATELVEAILVVFLLAQTRLVTFGGRVAFVTAAGILAAIATNVSYWNWYGFPRAYTASYMFIQVVGFLCVGIVAGLVLGKKATVAA
jgi:hypothetical protein